MQGSIELQMKMQILPETPLSLLTSIYRTNHFNVNHLWILFYNTVFYCQALSAFVGNNSHIGKVFFYSLNSEYFELINEYTHLLVQSDVLKWAYLAANEHVQGHNLV